MTGQVGVFGQDSAPCAPRRAGSKDGDCLRLLVYRTPFTSVAREQLFGFFGPPRAGSIVRE